MGSGRLPVGRAVAVALSRSFCAYRRGDGKAAMKALDDTPGAMRVLEYVLADLPGGARRFLEDCKLYRSDVRPGLSSRTIDSMLRIELGLLSGDDRPFSSELQMAAGEPLIEVDAERISNTFGVDGSRTIWRRGRWVRPRESLGG